MLSSTPIGLGNLLNNDRVTDICLNGHATVFIDQGEGIESYSDVSFFSSAENYKSWVIDLLSSAGRSWDAKNPFVDAALPSGHRLHVIFPPVARQGICVSLRRLPQPGTGKNPDRWRDSPLYEPLRDAVIRGDSILISGSTGSGKTTLASDLLSEVPEHERVIALEDTPELSPRHPHFLSLVSRPPNADGHGEVTLRTLLKQTLRMRPDRIVLGECRGAEVLDLLQSLNTGHRGALATLHANTPRDALRRIELLCLLNGGSALSLSTLRELMALGIQWIAQVQRIKGAAGRRIISEVWKIEGREGDTILMRPVIR